MATIRIMEMNCALYCQAVRNNFLSSISPLHFVGAQRRGLLLDIADPAVLYADHVLP